MSSHKIDNLRSYALSRTDKVPFILPVLIIHHNDHLAIFNVLNGLFDGI